MFVSNIALAIGLITVFALFVGNLASPNRAFAQVNAAIAFSCGAIPGTPETAPTEGTTLNYAVITGNQVVGSGVIKDDAEGNTKGWNPDGNAYNFQINDIPNVDVNKSVVLAHTNDPVNFNVCAVNWIADMSQLQTGQPGQPPATKEGFLKSSNQTSP